MKRGKFDPLLLLVPLGLLVLSQVMVGVRGPYNLGLNLDPEYQYLLNSTSLASAKLSVYVHHPGTPLQVLAGAVIFAKWLFGGIVAGWPPIAEAVAADHLGFLRTINAVLVLLLAALTYLAGWQVHRLTGSLLPALAAQLTPVLFMPSIEALPRVAPELPELICGMALVIPLAPLLVGPDPAASARTPLFAIGAGVVVGLAIATKANSFLLLILVLLFPFWRQMALFVGSAVGTFVVSLLPVAFSLGSMYQWFTNMATHTGHYGEGEAGLPTLQQYITDFRNFFETEPFVPYYLAFYAVLLVVSLVAVPRDDAPRYLGVRKMLAIGTAAIPIHALITAKHFNYHYILPAILLMMLLNTAAAHFLATATLRSRRLRIALIAVALILGYEGVRSNYGRMTWYAGWKADYHAHVAKLAEERAAQGDCRTMGYFRSSLPTFALALGNSMSGVRHHQALEAVYPGKIHLMGQPMSWSHTPQTEKLVAEVSAGGCVLVQGEVANRPAIEGFVLEAVYVPEQLIHGAEGLYRLELPSAEGGEPSVQ